MTRIRFVYARVEFVLINITVFPTLIFQNLGIAEIRFFLLLLEIKPFNSCYIQSNACRFKENLMGILLQIKQFYKMKSDKLEKVGGNTDKCTRRNKS